MDKIALGFSNTVDYEIEWDASYLEKLIRYVGLYEDDIKEMQNIRSMKELLSSILFHMRDGSGCGLLTEVPQVIEEFIKGTKYRVALGGTNLRAAEIISALGGSALVHLVSLNEDTKKLMPANISWIGGEEFQCCFPHIAIQFPKNAYIKANDIEITSPRENRVIYSGDTACAHMPLNLEFFNRACKARAVLLSSFDLITDPHILQMRVSEVKAGLQAVDRSRTVVFYEHAFFGDETAGDFVRNELGGYIDIYSMNEDEFQTLIGKKINLLDETEVAEGLMAAREKLPTSTMIVHTCYWALVFGSRADEFTEALQYGMLTASTRYRCQKVDKAGIEATGKLPLQIRAGQFAKRLEAGFESGLRCLPAAEINVSNPTTVGLGDSFVGGFLYKLIY
ncbi:hypothetical protein NXH76_05540 [Blautia schinkii]|nr:hypothetical protein [Blautia schinkii]